MRDIRCFPRFALPVRYPDLACLCFAIPCGTVPAQPLFLTVLDRHSIAPSCTLLPCRCCLLLGFTHALSCHAIAMPNHAKQYPYNATLSLIGYAAAILCKNLSSYTFASHHHTNPCRCRSWYAMYCRSVAPCRAVSLCLCLAKPSHATAVLSIILLYRCNLHTVLIGFSIAFFCFAVPCLRNTLRTVLCRCRSLCRFAPAAPLLAIPCQGQDLFCCPIMSHDLLCHCCI